MCFGPSNIGDLSRWNWDGDVIIQQPIVPSGRRVVGVRSRASYDIDVREFFTSSRNAVMEREIRAAIPHYLRQRGGSVARFEARRRDSFDFRAAVIANYVADTVAYEAGKGHDPWQFPDETLYIKAGDCEDRAFLIASLLLAAGVSPFNVRVAFGQMVVDETPHDHMWVVYKNERGYWTLVEPLCLGRALADDHLATPRPLGAPAPEVEYVPRFLFNDSHLWAVRGQAESDDLQRFLHRDWTRLNPKFAGDVHQTVVHQAIGAVPNVPSWVLKELDRSFTRLPIAGQIIDAPDLNIPDYSPLDHFDNGYVPESWGRVAGNLAQFKQDSRGNLKAFSRAAHAIADFYAHSSYLHFADLVDPRSDAGHAEPYDPASPPPLTGPPAYQPPSTFDLTDPKFTINTTLWKQGKPAAAARWAGQLISGRYAQPHDTQPGLTNHLIEGTTTIPASLRSAPGFSDRGSLPHHNQIAVDEDKPGDQHCLYASKSADPTDRMAYANQLRWRKNTAILHVRKAFVDNFTAPPD
jgi:hypothetical protein